MLNLTEPVDQLLQQAIRHHQAGRLAEAEGLYRKILAQQPNQPDAIRYLGVIATQVNQFDTAISLLRQAIALKPDLAGAWLDLGNAWQGKGQLPEAIESFKRAAALQPDFAAAFINLGNALHAAGKFEEAHAACRRGVELAPDVPEAHNNLAITLIALKKVEQAIASYQKAVALKPDFTAALFNLGNAMRAVKRLDEALACYARAIALDPRFTEAFFNLGATLQDLGRRDEAIVRYGQAIALKPDLFAAYSQLGDALQDASQYDEAIACYTRVIALKPDFSHVYNELGNVLKFRGRMKEALAAYQQFIVLEPNNPLGHNNIGAVYAEVGQSQKAIECYRRALELDPGYMASHVNLGNVWKDQGRLDETVACFRHALALAPNSAVVHSKLAYTLHFHPDYDARALYQECDRFNQLHAEPLKSEIRPHTNNRGAIGGGRRLKIGYVSPDFWAQAESYFVVPLLGAHDHRNFEIHGYASVMVPDAVTARQRKSVDVWHDVLGKTDAELSEQIRRDEIDILVDLTMHMANNRLLLFARKPAPVQVTWLAYPGTTGLKAIDYRITDAFMDPLDADTTVYSEQSIRLPDCWVCFDPLIETPPAAARNATDPICFGSLNNPCKMNVALLGAWADLLKAVPGSRLLLLAGLAGQREDIQKLFDSLGIEAGRVEFVGYKPRPEYLRLYDRIDIAIDPLPYNGITTTCDSLWMGVPVVTMAGRTAAGRAGMGMLSVLGLPDLVAKTPEEFIRIAADLANDPARRATLRTTLRNRMETSPLMNFPRYARNMEAAYRTMWKKWCAQ